MATVDGHLVIAEGQPDVELLETQVIDAPLQIKAADRGIGQGHSLARVEWVGVIDVEDVTATGSAVDRKQAIDCIDVADLGGRRRGQVRAGTADIDGIAATATVDVDRAIHGADVEAVVTAITIQVQAAVAAGLVDLDAVIIGATVQRGQAVEAGRIDGHAISTSLAIYHQLIGHTVDDDRVGTITTVQRGVLDETAGRRTMRAVDGEAITAVSEQDGQVLDRGVTDTGRRQAETGNRSGSQDAGVGGCITTIVDDQHVAATGGCIAVDSQRGIDAVQVAVSVIFRVRQATVGTAAHINGVRADTGIHIGDTGDGTDVDDIIAGVAVEVGCVNVGASNCEHITAAAEV